MVWKEQLRVVVTRTGILLTVPLRSPALVVTTARVVRSNSDPGHLEVFLNTSNFPTSTHNVSRFEAQSFGHPDRLCNASVPELVPARCLSDSEELR